MKNATNTVQEVEITARAKVFGRMGEHRFIVNEAGKIWVYDGIAGYFTRFHRISAGAQRRLRKLAFGA